MKKNLIFQGKFPPPPIFFFHAFFKTNFVFHAKISHLQLLPYKLFNFSSKVTAFEHTSCIPRWTGVSETAINLTRLLFFCFTQGHKSLYKIKSHTYRI